TLSNFFQTFDASGDKGTCRAGAADCERRLPGAEVEAYFEEWQAFLEGDIGARRVDQLLGTMGDIQNLLLIANDIPQRVEGQLTQPIAALKQVQSRLPRPVQPWVGDLIADTERRGPDITRRVLNEKLNPMSLECQGIVTNRFPFARGSSRDVSMPEFTRLFGPNGTINQFFVQELSPHVEIAPDGGFQYKGELANELSRATLRQFERAAKIRDVYFAEGSGTPQIRMTVAPVAIHPTVETAVLQINGQVITTRQRGNTPVNFAWPGTSGVGSTTLQFTPPLAGRQSQIVYNGPWAFLRWLNDGSTRVVGASMQTRHVIGGRHVGYRFDVAAAENPFFMNELSEFSCPTAF
ncbi:MAG: type VI secretion IcmF C-terminal domain-containing protein, partial [Pseudomonadota bacterium]